MKIKGIKDLVIQIYWKGVAFHGFLFIFLQLNLRYKMIIH